MSRVVLVTVEIDNAYGDAVIRTVETALVAAPPVGVVDLGDWADENVFPLTGTGRDGDATYEATIVASSDPTLIGRTFNFG